MKLLSRGQLTTGIVWGVIVMLISISLGGLIFAKISTEINKQAPENSIAENIASEVNSGAQTIFPLLVLVVIPRGDPQPHLGLTSAYSSR